MNIQRDSNGKLPGYAWPGGYQIIYITADCEIVCPTCANGGNDAEFQNPEYNDDQWTLISGQCFFEGPPEPCCHCNKMIESAYGDPEEGV